MIRIGKTAATSLLRDSLYIIAVVTNDIVMELGAVLINSSRDAYFDKLISTFRSQLIVRVSSNSENTIKIIYRFGSICNWFSFAWQRLYYLGARKIVVTNCACIGNIPVRRAIFPNDFVVLLNQVVRYYNSRLKKMLTELTRRVLQDQCMFILMFMLVWRTFSKTAKHMASITILSGLKICVIFLWSSLSFCLHRFRWNIIVYNWVSSL